jgi:hypothetical protein
MMPHLLLLSYVGTMQTWLQRTAKRARCQIDWHVQEGQRHKCSCLGQHLEYAEKYEPSLASMMPIHRQPDNVAGVKNTYCRTTIEDATLASVWVHSRKWYSHQNEQLAGGQVDSQQPQ